MSDRSMLSRLLVITVLVAPAEAGPASRPETQPLACPGDTDSCDLTIVGTLTYSKRDKHAKWDNLRLRAVIDGTPTTLHASINIPHRTRLKLVVGKRYRFTIAARSPFGASDLWVTDAKAR